MSPASDKVFLKGFHDHFERINGELNRTLKTRVTLIEDIGKFSLLGEGKRLRPLMFVLAAKLCGYRGEDIYRLSTIFEYIHTASLLHDDVMDNAEMRRNRPAASHQWGNSAAVLEGDFFYSKSFSIAVEYNNIPFLIKLTNTTTRMAEGQILELVHTHNWSLTKDEYMEIIMAKTAVLISAACACGAIIAGADQQTIGRLSEFGLNLGIAFQLMDDLLDYTATEAEFGKPVGKDLKEGKITLPLIYSLANFEIDEVERLKDLFKFHRAQEKDFQELIQLVRNNGTIDRIRKEANLYKDKADSYMNDFSESTFKQNLIDLNAYNLKRNY